MTQYFSDKIKLLSFVAILMVLYIHTDFHPIPNEIQGMKINLALQQFISDTIGGLAVPLFYMISGFLFFLNVNGMQDVLCKIRKRISTLLVPYILAALFYPLIMIAIESVPMAVSLMNGGGTLQQMCEWTWLENLDAIFYMKPGESMPWAFHLWFLRDLIIIVALSPLLFYVKKIMVVWRLAGIVIWLMLYLSAPPYITDKEYGLVYVRGLLS